METAKRHVGAVLGVVAEAAGEDLTRRLPLQLRVGYDLLSGRPQPA